MYVSKENLIVSEKMKKNQNISDIFQKVNIVQYP